MLRPFVFLFLAAFDIVSSKEVTQKSKYGCEGTNLTVDCDENEVIKIVRANYGRFSLSICNPVGIVEWDYNCVQRRIKIVHNCIQPSAQISRVTSLQLAHKTKKIGRELRPNPKVNHLI